MAVVLQHHAHLLPGDVGAGPEVAVLIAGHHAHLRGPGHGVGVPLPGGHVAEGQLGGGVVLGGHGVVEHLDKLGPGDVRVGIEEALFVPHKQAHIRGALHIAIVPGAALYIGEPQGVVAALHIHVGLGILRGVPEGDRVQLAVLNPDIALHVVGLLAESHPIHQRLGTHQEVAVAAGVAGVVPGQVQVVPVAVVHLDVVPHVVLADGQGGGDFQQVADHFHGLGVAVAHRLVGVPRHQAAVGLVGEVLRGAVRRLFIIGALGRQQVVDLHHLLVEVGVPVHLIGDGLGAGHLLVVHLLLLAAVVQAEAKENLPGCHRAAAGALHIDAVAHVRKPQGVRFVIAQGGDGGADVGVQLAVQRLGGGAGGKHLVEDIPGHAQAVELVHPHTHLLVALVLRGGEDLA